MTQAGHDRLIAKQKQLLNELTVIIGRDKSSSRIGIGDSSAPSSSDGCDQEEYNLRARIDEIDLIFGDSVQIVPAATQTRTIQIGQIVTVSMDNGDQLKTRQFWIDGFAETEPGFEPQVVGYYAPLIRALIGRKLRDFIEVEVEDAQTGTKTAYGVRILKIELPTEAHLAQNLLAA